MHIYTWIIAGCWLVFLVVWFVSAFNTKKSLTPRSAWFAASGLRILIGIVVIVAVSHVPAVNHTHLFAPVSNPIRGIVGAALAGIGLATALWARATIGRNWGMPMSRKENPELVTNGPYASIRHPIYTGVMLLMLGSTVGENAFWVLPLILFGTYFIFSALREEKLMTAEFPDQYPTYKARTKMLIPFIL